MKLERFKKDIQKNIDYLKEVVNYPLDHFCYPSGQWDENMIPILKELEIKSATTCDPGLMDIDTNPYKIPRIIDSESMSELVFYSEISGVSSRLRKLFNK
jgi:peptidoglycan/xylan/chitin deacetylase (PgdA/CDA1 family)